MYDVLVGNCLKNVQLVFEKCYDICKVYNIETIFLERIIIYRRIRTTNTCTTVVAFSLSNVIASLLDLLIKFILKSLIAWDGDIIQTHVKKY